MNRESGPTRPRLWNLAEAGLALFCAVMAGGVALSIRIGCAPEKVPLPDGSKVLAVCSSGVAQATVFGGLLIAAAVVLVGLPISHLRRSRRAALLSASISLGLTLATFVLAAAWR